MRLIVFTTDRDLECGAWWSALSAMPDAQVMICRQIPRQGAGEAWRRFRRSLRRNGFVYVPWRTTELLLGIVRGLFHHDKTAHVDYAPSTPARVLEHTDIHDRELLDVIRAWAPDVGISVGAPLLRRMLFSLPTHGTLNVHCGRIPQFRGRAVGFWELVHGAREIGATVHWIDDGIDTGRILIERSAPIYDRDDLRDVRNRALELGQRALAEALHLISDGSWPAGRAQHATGRPLPSPTVREHLALARTLALRRLQRSLHAGAAARWLTAVAAVYLAAPVLDLARAIRRRPVLRIFGFHRVSCLQRDAITVSPHTFLEQLSYVRKMYDVVNLPRGISAVRAGQRGSRPLAVLSFDGAFRDVFATALPIMRSMGLVGHCAVSGEGVVQASVEEALTTHELRQLVAEGWSVGPPADTQDVIGIGGDHPTVVWKQLVRGLGTPASFEAG